MTNQLRSTRRARGLAKWSLSFLSGVSPSLLTAIEKWAYIPTTDTQQRIADALGVSIEDIWIQNELPSEASTEGTMQGSAGLQEVTQ